MTNMTPASDGTAPMFITKPLIPLQVRHRAAHRRLATAFAGVLGQATTALHFDRSLADLRGLGLHGPGLIVAAEHMAATRLRELMNDAQGRSPGAPPVAAAGNSRSPDLDLPLQIDMDRKIEVDARPELAAASRALPSRSPATA